MSTTPDSSALTTSLMASPPQLTPATYPRKPDGSVNWRALVQPQFLYCKSEHKTAVATLLGKTPQDIYNLSPEDIAKVPDRYLVIRKAGILELARLRGYRAALPEVKHVQRDYVVVQTHIEWDDFEGQEGKVTGGVGEACPENTTRLGAAYLAATAENRAFARAVRSFLEIDIVCSDELGDKGVEPERDVPASASVGAANSPMDLSPAGTLTKAAQEAGFSFEQVKGGALARWKEDTAAIAKDPSLKRRIENDPTDWAAFKDIPPRDCLTLIHLIKARKAAAEEAKRAKEAAAANPVPAATPEAAPAPVPAKRTRTTRAPAATVAPQEAIAA